MDRLIEYYLTSKAINVFVTDRNGHLATLRKSCKYDFLAERVACYRRALIENIDHASYGSELHDLLINPLLRKGLIIPGDKLYLAPHRCLHYLPFQALGSGKDMLLDSNSLAYLPVGSTLPNFIRRRKEGGSLVVQRSGTRDGPLLRQSFHREAHHVAKLLGAEILADCDATPTRITQALPGKSLVHFTCHGVFSENAVHSSGLLLADDDGQDQIMDLATVSKLPLKVDLVVLAACETGLSERHPGDEMMGLVRAVTTAGARSVIATLWPVHSLSTELLVGSFYENYQKGMSKCEALRTAQLALRDYPRSAAISGLKQELSANPNAGDSALLDSRLADLERGLFVGDQSKVNKHLVEDRPFAHPYYWSGFTLIGDGR